MGIARRGIALGVVVAIASLIGCSRTPRDRLQGRWLGDTIENVAPEELPRANGWVKGTAIEFSGAKVTVTIPAETPRSGTFKIGKVDGERVTVNFLREEGGQDQADLRFVDDKTLRWDIGSGREIVLTKATN